MFKRFKSIWHPEYFHLQHMVGRGKACFEGWYFKLVDENGLQPYAIIPGIFLGTDAHAFIQVLDGRAGTSVYHRFAVSDFHANNNSFDVRIGRSQFTRSAIKLDINSGETSAEQSLQGDIQLDKWHGWPVTRSSPGVMGPYSFAPFMQCNHGILSMDHAISGRLAVDKKHTNFDGGRGYIEKDWGRGFPSGYIWAQSNHFGEEGISVSASVARIPWLTGSFRGHLIGVLLHGELYRFTTYTGAKIEHISVDQGSYRLCVSDQRHRLELSATRTKGALLHAPYDKEMVERVAETMTSRIELRLGSVTGGEPLFEGAGAHGCLEIQGDLKSIVDL